MQHQSYKLIYRRYAGLYFSMGVDVTDNELAYLESIHLFVELLDEFFRNVCELDIVFNFNKVLTTTSFLLVCMLPRSLPTDSSNMGLSCGWCLPVMLCYAYPNERCTLSWTSTS